MVGGLRMGDAGAAVLGAVDAALGTVDATGGAVSAATEGEDDAARCGGCEVKLAAERLLVLGEAPAGRGGRAGFSWDAFRRSYAEGFLEAGAAASAEPLASAEGGEEDADGGDDGERDDVGNVGRVEVVVVADDDAVAVAGVVSGEVRAVGAAVGVGTGAAVLAAVPAPAPAPPRVLAPDEAGLDVAPAVDGRGGVGGGGALFARGDGARKGADAGEGAVDDAAALTLSSAMRSRTDTPDAEDSASDAHESSSPADAGGARAEGESEAGENARAAGEAADADAGEVAALPTDSAPSASCRRSRSLRWSSLSPSIGYDEALLVVCLRGVCDPIRAPSRGSRSRRMRAALRLGRLVAVRLAL